MRPQPGENGVSHTGQDAGRVLDGLSGSQLNIRLGKEGRMPTENRPSSLGRDPGPSAPLCKDHGEDSSVKGSSSVQHGGPSAHLLQCHGPPNKASNDLWLEILEREKVSHVVKSDFFWLHNSIYCTLQTKTSTSDEQESKGIHQALKFYKRLLNSIVESIYRFSRDWTPLIDQGYLEIQSDPFK